jgi:hypothetical protein
MMLQPRLLHSGIYVLTAHSRCQKRTRQGTSRAQIGRNNQIEDDVDDVERYCGNRAVRGGNRVVQCPRRRWHARPACDVIGMTVLSVAAVVFLSADNEDRGDDE